jgi:hypothetical protein
MDSEYEFADLNERLVAKFLLEKGMSYQDMQRNFPLSMSFGNASAARHVRTFIKKYGLPDITNPRVNLRGIKRGIFRPYDLVVYLKNNKRFARKELGRLCDGDYEDVLDIN